MNDDAAEDDAEIARRRIAMSMRISPKTREKIEAEAAKSGRSLTQEIELRLEQGFRDEDRAPLFHDVVYGPQAAAFLGIIGRTLREVTSMARHYGEGSARTGDWISDPQAFGMVEGAIGEILDRLRPPGDSPPMAILGVTDVGPSFARGILRGVAFGRPDSADDNTKLGAEAREKLGAATAARLAERFEREDDQVAEDGP
jgi:TraY domain